MSIFLTNEMDKILVWLGNLPEPIAPPNIPPGPAKPCRPRLPGNDVLEDIEIALEYLDNDSRWHLLHLRANILEKMRWQEAEREHANTKGKEPRTTGYRAKDESNPTDEPNMATQ